jgi:hypothetical protein
MSFLGKLADQLSNQFSLGENNNRSLDSVINGKKIKYGKLGDFAKQFDQSAERNYVESGYLRQDSYNVVPKQTEILMQEPQATVLIKKRMFSSIADNFRPDYMDDQEKIYYKAMRVLFANKCSQISALEKLSKIQSITQSSGFISDSIIPVLLTLSDTIYGTGLSFGSSVFGDALSFKPLGGDDSTKLLNTMDQLRKIYAFSNTAQTTTWMTNQSNLFQSVFGQGTGVIELTNFTSFTTAVTVEGIKNPGSFRLTLTDPYQSMLITEWDIEKAIADSVNMFKNSNIFNLIGKNSVDDLIAEHQLVLNNIRSERGASPISIRINPDTLLGKKVIAILDRTGKEILFKYEPFPGFIGNGVTVFADFLRGGSIAGNDGLDQQTVKTQGIIKSDSLISKNTSELSEFNSLITAIFSKIQLESSAQNTLQLHNEKTNYARRKLRFNFANKLIIQPMDIVHIYINSKSNWDNKLLGGMKSMFTGYGFLQALNTVGTNIKTFTSLLKPQSSGIIKAEKDAFVGENFPDYLWSMIRGKFINENEGTHIFAGVVEQADDSWSDSKFQININGKDNTFYFDQGKINFKPGVDAFNGAIYDPLTPFKSNFDTITDNFSGKLPELLQENQEILGTSENKKSLVKIKSGPNAGQKLYSDNFYTEAYIDPRSGVKTSLLHAPDGLVYRWKEGIGVFVQFGNSLELNDSDKVGTPALAQYPFAGQDVMNVISLLITGQPYNYSNYWRAANNLFGFEREGQSKIDAANTYIHSLRNQLTKNNSLWGNFIPFKNLVVNEKSFGAAQNAQYRIQLANNQLRSNMLELEQLNNSAVIFGAANALSNQAQLFSQDFEDNVKLKADKLTKSIQADLDAIAEAEKLFADQSIQAGVDATFNLSEMDSSKIGISASNPNMRKELRRRINYLTRRMSYNIRANEDKNLFIVDDSYDNDYDLLAYEKSLQGQMALYNNEFLSTREKIKHVADLLNLEVFADTQGHIRVRPPQYNKMPSSVFYRMMYLKKAYKIQVFPQFLDDIFSTQISSLRQRIEVLEDSIRLNCAIIRGNNSEDDKGAQDFILNTTNSISKGVTHNTGSSFKFLSSSNGNIVDINELMHSVNPDEFNTQITSFVSSTNLSEQASTKDAFNNAAKHTVIYNALIKQNLENQGYTIGSVDKFNANSYVDQLVSRIQTKSGNKVNKNDYLVPEISQAGKLTISTNAIDIFKVTSELQTQIQERQKLIKLFYSSLSNAQELRSLDVDHTTTNKLISPSMSGNSEVPEIFEHMIEDESYNDYGGNSGSRYIIKNSQIKTLRISQHPPDFTGIQVTGFLNDFNPRESLPQSLGGGFADNGNGLVTAVAIDYDMWRNYGFKNVAPITVPFLNDPKTQTAPYATMLLSRNRKNILRGNLSIAGNEYMQPGEVVYLEDRGLLFYVTAVEHTFTYGNTFTTSLQLSYGHTPGEYIPTCLDIIGKMIYNNRDTAQFTMYRQNNTNRSSDMGVLQLAPNTTDSGLPGIEKSLGVNPPQSGFTSENEKTLNNILFQAAYLINKNNVKGTNVEAQVQLRIYYDNNNPVNNDIRIFAEQAQAILTGKITYNRSSALSGSTFQNPTFPSDKVIIERINIDSENENRSPSQKALDAARNKLYDNITPTLLSQDAVTTSNDKIRAVLFGYIVDCWLVFEQR